MAIPIPKVGFARFLKEGTQTFKGVDEAVLRNIDACVELASQVRTGFGPSGMNKMIINHIEKLFVTNDAATILKELKIEHPAARLLVLASQQQEKQIGDGTNTVVMLGAALLENAMTLINMGLKPVEIAEGYEKAYEKLNELLPKLVVAEATNPKDYESVRTFLRSSIASKQFSDDEFIANMVAKACIQITPENTYNFNVDNVRIVKILGSGVASSRLVNGMVFKRGAEGVVKSAKKANVAVFTCPFDLTQTETKGTVLMETAKDLLEFSAGEEATVESQVKALADDNVNVVVAAGKFGDLYLHFLNKYNIMGVRLTSKFDLRRLCLLTGARAQARVCSPGAAGLGFIDNIYVDEIGGTEVTVFDRESTHPLISTIIVRGSSQSRMDDVERAIDDGVNTYKALTKDSKFLAGAGAVEIELARQIELYGDKMSNLDQYSIKKYAQSLEVVPKQLAENAGLEPTKLLSVLYTEHEQGGKNQGVNVSFGEQTVDANVMKIYDHYVSKKTAIRLATEAAITILNIDKIIMSKQAGGPKPRAPLPQDEDESGMA
ncbi:hypothetical protein AB6A40_004869 [Gnathostoma spinigerum]|uniref:T-complex protein 1 subunit theta n=1 Tax=Gnathostoma spinigerum TaxID=75299 RepID=A0ABD6EEY0_9BILA